MFGDLFDVILGFDLCDMVVMMWLGIFGVMFVVLV